MSVLHEHQSRSLPSDARGTFVGQLREWNPETTRCGNTLDLYSDQEVLIGRDKRTCHYVVNDPFISNRHLRIYTIIFDKDNSGEVAPLVYAQDLSRNGTLWNGSSMGKGEGAGVGAGAFLLSDGDVLGLSPNFYLVFCAVDHDVGCSFDDLQLAEMKTFEDQYTVTNRMLGSGAYGKVHMAVNKQSGQQLACKIVDLRSIKKRAVCTEERQSWFFKQGSLSSYKGSDGCVVTSRVDRIRLSREIRKKREAYCREANILQQLDHPNIIRLEMVIRSENTMYLFQELVTAGDLFSFIEFKGGRLYDVEAAVVVRQILLALEYLHDRNIVHRDLKPDNILMTSLVDGCRVILTDFGCARYIKPRAARMSTILGTFEYCAPEVSVNQDGYTKAVDLWSLGCVTAGLLIGASPFVDPLTGAYSEEIARSGDLSLLDAELVCNKVGRRAQNFLQRLLVVDETKRMDVKQALNHTWFTNPAHKREFERLYERSIQNWTPRARKSPLMVRLDSVPSKERRLGQIDTQDITALLASSEPEEDGFCASSADVIVKCEESHASEESQCGHAASRMSSTLSDPDLPPRCVPMNRAERATHAEPVMHRKKVKYAPSSHHQDPYTWNETNSFNDDDLPDSPPSIRIPHEAVNKVMKNALAMNHNAIQDAKTRLENIVCEKSNLNSSFTQSHKKRDHEQVSMSLEEPDRALCKTTQAGDRREASRKHDAFDVEANDKEEYLDEVFAVVSNSLTGYNRYIPYGNEYGNFMPGDGAI